MGHRPSNPTLCTKQFPVPDSVIVGNLLACNLALQRSKQTNKNIFSLTAEMQAQLVIIDEADSSRIFEAASLHIQSIYRPQTPVI